MALSDKTERDAILNHLRDQRELLEHNETTLQIFEGDLVTHLLAAMRKQLSVKAFENAKHRISPINVLQSTVDKLSQIYERPPQRILLDENAKDEELKDFYTKNYDMNVIGQYTNELFNLHKGVLWEPYVDEQLRLPRLRAVPGDRFTVMGTDPTNPLRVTHVIKIMGTMEINGNQEQVIFVYTDDEFVPMSISSGDIILPILMNMNNPEGINPFGKLPFVYLNRSRSSLIPTMDSDMLKMALLIPLLLTDLNYAVMFQAFSIMYGIDIDETNLEMNPSQFWQFKSDKSNPDNAKPEVGMIKPEVDIVEVMQLAVTQFQLWMQSRNIRPGATGGAITAENMASGISKMVDEMDTFKDRKKQVPFFKTSEEQLWDLTMHTLHPAWVAQGALDEKRLFAKTQKIEVLFPEQKPNFDRGKTLDEQEKELGLQLTTRRRSLKTLNPDLTEKAIDELMREIEKENTIELPGEDPEGEEQDPPGDQDGDDDE